MRSMVTLFVLLGFACANAVAVPTSIDLPIDISTSSEKYCVSITSQCSNGWSFWQHKSGFHAYGKGVGGADDTFAYDVNLNSPQSDYDNGQPVYAIESGDIYTGAGWGTSNYGQLLINHTTASGDLWSSGYLHMSGIPKKNGSVTKGELIGYISNKSPDNVANHLHFAIYNTHGKNSLKSVNVSFSGVSANAVAASPVSSLSYFDGAGSLVRPSESCWGCNKDEAIMHPRAGRASTVVFQWLYDADLCEHVDVTTTPNVGPVVVRARSWSDHLMSLAFASTTPVSVPTQGSWTIFSVTSDKPLTSDVSVQAFCKPRGDARTGSSNNFTKDLVGFDNDYFWSGNGSLISKSNKKGVGATEDYAVTYSTHRSLTVFQWYSSSSCSKVIVGDSGGAGATGSVSMKEWSALDFGAEICSRLPCTVSTASNGYFLIKVKSEANAVPSGRLSATCTN